MSVPTVEAARVIAEALDAAWPGVAVRLEVGVRDVVVDVPARYGWAWGFIARCVTAALNEPCSVHAFGLRDGRMRLVLAPGPWITWAAAPAA